LTKAIDKMQEEFKCCIVNTTAKTRVPDSCCKTMKKGCGADPATAKYTQSCVTGLEDWVKKNLPIVGGVAIGVLLIEVLAIIFSLVLFCQAKKLGQFA